MHRSFVQLSALLLVACFLALPHHASAGGKGSENGKTDSGDNKKADVTKGKGGGATGKSGKGGGDFRVSRNGKLDSGATQKFNSQVARAQQSIQRWNDALRLASQNPMDDWRRKRVDESLREMQSAVRAVENNFRTGDFNVSGLSGVQNDLSTGVDMEAVTLRSLREMMNAIAQQRGVAPPPASTETAGSETAPESPASLLEPMAFSPEPSSVAANPRTPKLIGNDAPEAPAPNSNAPHNSGVVIYSATPQSALDAALAFTLTEPEERLRAAKLASATADDGLIESDGSIEKPPTNVLNTDFFTFNPETGEWEDVVPEGSKTLAMAHPLERAFWSLTNPRSPLNQLVKKVHRFIYPKNIFSPKRTGLLFLLLIILAFSITILARQTYAWFRGAPKATRPGFVLVLDKISLMKHSAFEADTIPTLEKAQKTKDHFCVSFNPGSQAWELIKVNTEGEAVELIGELRPGSVVRASVLGGEVAYGHFELEPHGRWKPTQNKERYLVSRKINPGGIHERTKRAANSY